MQSAPRSLHYFENSPKTLEETEDYLQTRNIKKTMLGTPTPNKEPNTENLVDSQLEIR